jgi:hypothetical protein
MWLDITTGFVNEASIEYIEVVSDGAEPFIRLHFISGRVVEITGGLAKRILVYARYNKVQLIDNLDHPISYNNTGL